MTDLFLFSCVTYTDISSSPSSQTTSTSPSTTPPRKYSIYISMDVFKNASRVSGHLCTCSDSLNVSSVLIVTLTLVLPSLFPRVCVFFFFFLCIFSLSMSSFLAWLHLFCCCFVYYSSSLTLVLTSVVYSF